MRYFRLPFDPARHADVWLPEDTTEDDLTLLVACLRAYVQRAAAATEREKARRDERQPARVRHETNGGDASRGQAVAVPD